MLDLTFFGAPVANQSLFNLPRGILVNRQFMRNDRTNRGTARLTELQRRIRILMHENLFDRELVRAVFPDNRADPVEYLF